jgi:uncharacterized protein YeaO (DUF488 family)
MGRSVAKTASVAIQLKRAYEPPEARDGVRVLVDRLWPRGVAKAAADLDAWMADLGPTDELRTWFGHQPERWAAFGDKYRGELATPLRQTLLAALQGVAGRSTLTLVYGARGAQENEAVVLRQYLLRERAQPAGTWDAPMKLLVTAAVVAAAHPDAVAPAAGVQLFAPPLLTGRELDGARQELLTSGQLRAVEGGWQLTARGRRQVRQLSRLGAANAASS